MGSDYDTYLDSIIGDLTEGLVATAPLSSSNGLARLFVVFEFTTIRYHFLAFCLLLGQPAWLLLFYAFHFNTRWIMRVGLVTLRYLLGKTAQ